MKVVPAKGDVTAERDTLLYDNAGPKKEAFGKVASGTTGVNCNSIVDDALFDPLTGNAVLNGVPVTVAPVVALVQ